MYSHGYLYGPIIREFLMRKSERQFLRTQNDVLQVRWRYIDDIFAIWTNERIILTCLFESLNRYHITIKFTANWPWSVQEITFLDTTISLVNGHIQTDLHIKHIDTHQFLWMDSCHPNHFKTAIPYSQALRLSRIFSWKEDLLRDFEIL